LAPITFISPGFARGNPVPLVQRTTTKTQCMKKKSVIHWVTAVFLFSLFWWVSEVTLPTKNKKTAVTH